MIPLRFPGWEEYEWEPWFCWYPKRIEGRWIWWRTVEWRCVGLTWGGMLGLFGVEDQYRLLRIE